MEINTVKGRIKINIPEECENGKTLRLKNLGMPDYKNNDVHGDLYLKLYVELPKDLSSKEKKLFKELAKLQEKRSNV